MTFQHEDGRKHREQSKPLHRFMNTFMHQKYENPWKLFQRGNNIIFFSPLGKKVDLNRIVWTLLMMTKCALFLNVRAVAADNENHTDNIV